MVIFLRGRLDVVRMRHPRKQHPSANIWNLGVNGETGGDFVIFKTCSCSQILQTTL